jgi:Tol biopolymer transport system component
MNAGTNEVEDLQFSESAEIWTVPAAGGTPTRLTTMQGPDGYPDYSPDGRTIVFSRWGTDVWLMDADGSDPHRIRKKGGFTPRFSPDGSLVAFTTFDDSVQPTVDLGGTISSVPLVTVQTLDIGSGEVTPVGDTGMATDFNVPVWWSNELLLIRRVGH